ncbi:MAG TPA: RDD family protein [Bryobacteraceae bacterium]|nr:RDD family protein [Bryobacteraceae bacterium]
MMCGYCGQRNSEGEHRCRRCGRRPDDTPIGPFTPHRVDGALAAAVAPAPAAESAGFENSDYSRAIQGTLFAARPASNVIPFESYASARVETQPRAQTEVPRKPAARRPASRSIEAQASLDFVPVPATAPRTLGTTVEAVISCEWPVATALHRAVAAALDWSMVLIGYGLFLLAFRLTGGTFEFTKTNLLVFAGTLPLVAFTYGLFWTVAGAETPGMRWAQLRLITFDGFPLSPKHRILRFAGSCLSLCTVIGLLWALADEESLNWQDHISRTFPTPLASETQIFHRQ